MPEIKITIPHQLTRDEVKRRLQNEIGRLRSDRDRISRLSNTTGQETPWPSRSTLWGNRSRDI